MEIEKLYRPFEALNIRLVHFSPKGDSRILLKKKLFYFTKEKLLNAMGRLVHKHTSALTPTSVIKASADFATSI